VMRIESTPCAPHWCAPLWCAAVTTLTALASMACATSAQARLHPFVFGGGQQTRTEKEDFDVLLDPITIRGDEAAWEAGFGLRFFSSKDIGHLPLASGATGIPRWEVRPRIGFGGGDLEGTEVRVARQQQGGDIEYSFRERFETSSWHAAVSFLVNLHPTIGLFAGPSVQTVDFEAKRDWEGQIPLFCGSCGDGKDQTRLRYGLLEVGAQLRPTRWPIGAELYWIPKRFELSTNRRTTQDQTYGANFATLTRAFGGRIVVEF